MEKEYPNPDILEEDENKLGVNDVVSSTDFTGLIPNLPSDDETEYDDIYDVPE